MGGYVADGLGWDEGVYLRYGRCTVVAMNGIIFVIGAPVAARANEVVKHVWDVCAILRASVNESDHLTFVQGSRIAECHVSMKIVRAMTWSAIICETSRSV